MTVRVACIQVTATADRAAGIAVACERIREAAANGAQLATLPENATLLAPGEAMRRGAPPSGGHPARVSLAATARETGTWVLAGSLAERTDGGRLANRSLLFDDRGAVAGAYDKLHMFDAVLDGGESYRESASYRPGDRAVLAPTPWGPLGMTICYDLRFPALFRTLAQAGAAMIAVPSAFTVPTGRAHWHVLLRARAIETGCFILAPAQCGVHYGSRRTFGHSLIVGPWGDVMADGGPDPGIVYADLDLAASARARRSVPSLRHDRDYAAPARVAAGPAAPVAP